MDPVGDERPSDSPFIEMIWRHHSKGAHAFLSMAGVHSGLVITKYRDKTTLTIRGPETRATPAYDHTDAECIGILFRPGVFMQNMPPTTLIDRRDLHLPGASSQSFWLHGSAWQFPDFENADTFVERLIRQELLVRSSIVNAVVQGEVVDTTPRTVQRHFLQTTGLTQGLIRQIERARQATRLLKQGRSILDTVYEAGYFDQPHLTRSLKHFIGLTPTQILDANRVMRLSLLYKTAPLLIDYAESVLPTDAGLATHR